MPDLPAHLPQHNTAFPNTTEKSVNAGLEEVSWSSCVVLHSNFIPSVRPWILLNMSETEEYVSHGWFIRIKHSTNMPLLGWISQCGVKVNELSDVICTYEVLPLFGLITLVYKYARLIKLTLSLNWHGVECKQTKLHSNIVYDCNGFYLCNTKLELRTAVILQSQD